MAQIMRRDGFDFKKYIFILCFTLISFCGAYWNGARQNVPADIVPLYQVLSDQTGLKDATRDHLKEKLKLGLTVEDALWVVGAYREQCDGTGHKTSVIQQTVQTATFGLMAVVFHSASAYLASLQPIKFDFAQCK